MIEEHSNSNKIVLLAMLLGGAAVVGLIYFTRSQEPPKPVEKIVEKPIVAKAEPPKEEANTANDDALKAQLLGENKQPPKEEPKPRPHRVVRRKVEQVDRQATAEEEDDPLARKETGLSDATFHSTMERWRAVKSCLHTHKGRIDETRGALRISMKIMGSGEVAECKVFDESNEIAKLIAPCVEKQARQLKFPAFEGEPFAVKEAKFVF